MINAETGEFIGEIIVSEVRVWPNAIPKVRLGLNFPQKYKLLRTELEDVPE